MDKFTTGLIKVNLILVVLSLFSMIYIFSAFEYLKPKVIQFQELGSTADTLAIIYLIAFIVILLFHIVSLITVMQTIRLSKKINFFKAVLLFLLSLSMIFLLADLTMFQEIGKQYEARMATAGEWTILYMSHYLHSASIMFMFILLLTYVIGFKKAEEVEAENKETVLFLTAQYIGVLCGLIGLIAIFLSISYAVPIDILKQVIFTFSIILLLPYFSIVILWLFIKCREKMTNWYDEKQFQDMGKSSLVSLVLSIIFLAALYLVSFSNVTLQHYLSLFWFPVYFFFNLFVFAGSVMIFSKR